MLLERDKLTSGTSWHAAGLIMQLRSTHSATEIARMNALVYPTLAAETGQETGYAQRGTLAIARSDARIRWRSQSAVPKPSCGPVNFPLCMLKSRHETIGIE